MPPPPLPAGEGEGAQDPFERQVTDLGRLLRAAGVPVLRLQGHEADSVIGALTTSPTLQGQPLVIVSCDHDFLQLVDERVKMFDDVRKVMWDEKAVRAHYQLKTPREVSAYKALVGDKSDGVKGVYKCGPVMARKAIRVMGRFIRQTPYVQRLAWPSNALTQRVIGAWIREGLVSVASDVTALIHCYKLVDIPYAAAPIAETVEARQHVASPHRVPRHRGSGAGGPDTGTRRLGSRSCAACPYTVTRRTMRR